jgi:hypothetical protein
MKIFFFLTNNNNSNISGNNLHNTQPNTNDFENNLKLLTTNPKTKSKSKNLSNKKNLKKLDKTDKTDKTNKTEKTTKSKKSLTNAKSKNTKNIKAKHKQTNKITSDMDKQMDPLDYEIRKLEERLKEKNNKNITKTIDLSTELSSELSDNLSINSDLNSNKDLLNKPTNIKKRNLLSNNNESNKIQDINSTDSNIDPNITDTKKAIDGHKIELFKLLLEAKKKQNNSTLSVSNSENTSNKSNGSNKSNESNESNSLDMNKSNDSDESKQMKIVFNNKSTNIYVDSDDENNIRVREYGKKSNNKQNKINEQISDYIDNKKQIKNVSIIKKINNPENYSNRSNLCVVSNLVTERECYNDYMIKLSEPVRLVDLNINNIILPKRNTENISENNNELQVEINSIKKTIELDPDYYNRNEIVECLNDCFKAYQLEIISYIDPDDKFTFETKNGEKLKLISSDKSILPYLGFGKNTYFSKNKYIGENSLDVGDNIFYLVIGNICSEPMFRIDMDSDEPYIEKLIELDSDIEIDRLYIQFYKTKNSLIKNDSEYSFFFESEHEIDFEFI